MTETLKKTTVLPHSGKANLPSQTWVEGMAKVHSSILPRLITCQIKPYLSNSTSLNKDTNQQQSAKSHMLNNSNSIMGSEIMDKQQRYFRVFTQQIKEKAWRTKTRK